MKTKKILVGLATFLFAMAFVFTSCDRDTAVTGVELSEHRTPLAIGESDTLVATVIPANATNQIVIWSSSDNAVVTVIDGIVQAIGRGTATVTVTTDDGNRTAYVVYEVGPSRAPVEGVNIDGVTRTGEGEPLEIEVVDGIKTVTVMHRDFFSFQHSVSPEDTEDAVVDRRVTWTSRNTANIMINAAGMVTHTFPGTTYVVLTSVYDATIQDSVRIIIDPIRIESIEFAPVQTTMGVGHTQTLTVNAVPTDASFLDIDWEMVVVEGDEPVSLVAGVVTALNNGVVRIIATANEGGHAGDDPKTIETTITITGVAATGVELDTNALSLAPGAFATLVATVLPEEAVFRTVTWTSSNPTVASVSTAGVVMAAHPGTTTITATTTDGGFEATATVTVTAGVPAECGADHILALGTVSFESDQTWTTTGRGRTLIWSDAVHATGCNKEDFAGGAGNLVSDCRRGSATGAPLPGVWEQGEVVAPNRSFFSWCAVMTHAETLCPAPWRVPTREDFAILDIHFGGDGVRHRFFAASGAHITPAPQSYAEAEAVINGLGVLLVGHMAQGPPVGAVVHNWPGTGETIARNFRTFYWQMETTPGNVNNAGAFEVGLNYGRLDGVAGAGQVFPQGTIRPTQPTQKFQGLSLRCVRDN